MFGIRNPTEQTQTFLLVSHSHLITSDVSLLNSNRSDGINLPTDLKTTIMLLIRQLMTSTSNHKHQSSVASHLYGHHHLHQLPSREFHHIHLGRVSTTKESSHLNHNHRFPIPIHGCTSDVLKWTVRIQPAALYATCPQTQMWV